METRCGGIFFTSKFDGGNLAKVEKVEREEDEGVAPISTTGEPRPDYEFNVWTRPDCAETEYENPNRSWFYFGIKGYSPNRLLKINIQNLNKQGKLYGQGYTPFVRLSGPKHGKWERIRDKTTFEIVDAQFILSFTYRFPDQRGQLIQFAFCYPWSYDECQQRLAELDIKYKTCSGLDQESPPDSVYYRRELLCYSLSKLRTDLITVSDCRGITNKPEPRFDSKLFPDKTRRRCRRFLGKRVYVLTSRVHPGETPGSHVFNGFLEFILRENDPRAKALRRNFVFKLIPILNPDGVLHGHYRTDTRGVNLNRVYLDPDPSLYPTIYAAKSVLVYYHVHYRVRTPKKENPGTKPCGDSEETTDHIGNDSDTSLTTESQHSESAEEFDCKLTVNLGAREAGKEAVEEIHGALGDDQTSKRGMSSASSKPTESVRVEENEPDPLLHGCSKSEHRTEAKTFHSNFARFDVEFDGKLKFLPERDSSQTEITCDLDRDSAVGADNSNLSHAANSAGVQSNADPNKAGDRCHSDDECVPVTDHHGNEGSDDDRDFTPRMSGDCKTPHLSDPELLEIPASHSGIAFYVDLHGHASKRGCFIYGNYLEQEEQMVDCLLYPKLISMNTAHFDFGGCNFSLKNMYTKDKRDGMTKEGSGRVAIYKAIGIVRSYTLECNYNMGRMVNCVPPASGDDGGATPPPLAGFPPKYTIAHYEEVGRACAVAALDVTETNPWSRVSSSEYYNLHGVKEWVRRYYRSFKGSPAKGNRVIPRVPTQRPSVCLNPTNGSLTRPRLSLTDGSAATTSTSSLNGRRPPPVRRDSNQASRDLGRRESTQPSTVNARVQSIGRRRASDTDQSARSSGKRPIYRVTTPPQKEPPSRQQLQRQAPVLLSFSKRDTTGKVETSTPNNNFRPVRVNETRRDRTLPACVTRPGPDRVPSTSPAPPGAPPSLAEVVDLSAVQSERKDRPPERYAHLNLFADDGSMKLRQTAFTQTGTPSTTCYQQQLEVEEKKVQQLKDLCSGTGVTKPRRGSQILLNRALDGPKSDPLKRKAVRRFPGKRRSNSHSPKSAKGGRSWTSSGTDSEAEKKRTNTNKKRKNLKTIVRGAFEELDFDSRHGLQAVGITGIKLSPRPTLQTDMTMHQDFLGPPYVRARLSVSVRPTLSVSHPLFPGDQPTLSTSPPKSINRHKTKRALSSQYPESAQFGLAQLTLLSRHNSSPDKLVKTPR